MPQSVSPSVRRQQMINKLGFLTETDLLGKFYVHNMLEQAGTATPVMRGDTIAPPANAEALYCVKKGRIQISRVDIDGAKQVVATLEPGALFGKMAPLGQHMNQLSAEALDDSVVIVINRANLERLFKTYPDVGLHIMELLGKRLIEAEARLEDIAFKSIPSRLASLLLRLMPNGKNLVIGYTHQELADMIGTYRETTTQTLNNFKEQGMVQIGRKRIEVRNRSALEHLAER